MYLLFRCHHILPAQCAAMGPGEWTIAKAFVHYQEEKRKEEIERINREMRR